MSGRFILASLMMVLSGCIAQPPPPPAFVAAPPPGPNLAERLSDDEQRIQQGLQQGQLTGPEYNELQRRHDAIEATRRDQLAMGGGRFGPGQYEQLLGREQALSQTIYEYRHNGATPTAH
jgi:hypothetical protein